jgi:beta-galactosidase
VATQQLTIREASLPALEIKNAMVDRFTSAGPVSILTNDRNYLIITNQNFTLEFDKRSGFICRYLVGGEDYLVLGTELKPNFWRAPTDNDYGANLQRRYAVWKDIQYMRPQGRPAEGGGGGGENRSFVNAEMVDDIAVVTVVYNLEEVKATLTMTYKINNVGEVLVNESLTADPTAEISEMFRFGMRMKMPGQFNLVNYYGRGPIESYADRKESQFFGLFKQDVDQQFYNYLRTQETGNKSDIRWWQQVNMRGDGLLITSDEPFSASALFYPQETLDNGPAKYNSHIEFKTKDKDVTVTIDKLHMGVACVNSWGAIPLPEYRIPYKDYSFTFKLTPVKGQLQ